MPTILGVNAYFVIGASALCFLFLVSIFHIALEAGEFVPKNKSEQYKSFLSKRCVTCEAGLSALFIISVALVTTNPL